MSNPADYQERLQALDIGRSFIVQAPAGSGKTELLTRRFLSLLAVVEKPESILAITFTRKASSEMLSRILEALRAADAGEIPKPSDVEKFKIASKALKRDQELGWNLLKSPGRLRVCTIDSLCVSLVRQMPFLSRLGAPPAIVEDATELYREAARMTLAELDSDQPWAAQVERTLDHLSNDWENAEALLIEMLGRRDQWLHHVNANGREELEKGLQLAIEDDLARARQFAPKELELHLSRLARLAAANIADDSNPIADLRDMNGYPSAEIESAEIWKGLAELLLTKDGKWRSKFDKRVGFPPGGTAKAAMQDLIDHCKHHNEWNNALNALRQSPPARYEDAQWNIIESLSTTMRLAAGQLQRVFSKRGAVDFTELLQRALTALEGEEGPTDLAYVLDGRIEHILMDEFQDTSLSQKKLLANLMYGWSHGDNRSLFLVGDPMQSIYRFREAEVGIFLDAWQNGMEAVSLERLKLSVNFRSQAGIVDWVNSTFSRIFPENADRDWGAVPYAASEAAKGRLRGTAVNVHPFFSDDEDGETDRAVGIACDALGEEGTTVAILARAKDHVKEIARKLQARGQRYQAVELDLLKDRPAVRDLNALLRALLFPADRIAWLSILRAPWCGLTLAELESIAGKEKRASMYDLLAAADRPARLNRVYTVITKAIEDRKRLPMARWLEETWLQLGGAATLPDDAARQDAHRYLEFLDSFDVGCDIANLEEFENGLEKLYAKPDPQADGRLQVMTIHKAKGLEFDVVILPGLGNKRASDGKRLLYWLQRSRQNSDSVVLASASEAGSEKDAIAKYIKSIEKKRNKHEEERLLYVAATRARRELHLIGAVAKNGEPASDSPLGTLWDSVKKAFEEPKQLSLLAVLPALRQNRLERFVENWQVPPKPQAVDWEDNLVETSSEEISFDWSGLSLRSVGTVVHRFLERISREGPDSWPVARLDNHRKEIARQLQSLGIPAAEVQENLLRAIEAIRETLGDTRGRWILAGHEEAESEWELTGEIGSSLRSIKIDRSFRDSGVRWIIDFKTGWHEGSDSAEFLNNEMERYRTQLESYGKLVAALDQRPIKLGLYFPLMKGWREWSYERSFSA